MEAKGFAAAARPHQVLIPPQRHDRADPGGSPSGEVGGGQGDQGEDDGDPDEGKGSVEVMLYSRVVEVGGGQARKGEGQDEAPAANRLAPRWAPEVLAGAFPSPAHDLWSLHLVLWEALAGRHPFAGMSLEAAVHRMAREEIPDIRKARPD